MSVHIPYETQNNKWFDYEQQWKLAAMKVLDRYISPAQRPFTSVLDFGCGRGEFLKLLKDGGYPCTGTDFDEECVRLSTQIASTVRLADDQLDAYFKDESYDVVSAIHVLEHLQSPARTVMSLARISRKILLFVVPNLQSTAYLTLRGEPYKANEGHVCGWDYAHFRNFLTNICGLKIIVLEPDVVPFTTKLGKLDRLIERAVPRKAIARLETGLLLRRFRYLSNSIIALCEK